MHSVAFFVFLLFYGRQILIDVFFRAWLETPQMSNLRRGMLSVPRRSLQVFFFSSFHAFVEFAFETRHVALEHHTNGVFCGITCKFESHVEEPNRAVPC